MANKGYLVYLDYVLLPVTPSNINLKIQNQNKTIKLINGSEVNILQSAGLTNIEFSFIVPQLTKYPFAMYQNDEFKDVSYYTSKLEELKSTKKPFQFIVIRRSPLGQYLYDTNMTVSLEHYSIIDDASNGFDVMISVSLKQYTQYKTKVLNSTNSSNSSSSTNSTNSSRPNNNDNPDVYVVKAGDTLWSICKKYLGDGQKYSEIAKLNNIKNPNLIYPSQVIRLR